MSLLTSASDIPDGVVSNPDGRDGADGNGGDLVRMSHPGIVQVRLNDTPGTIEDGTDLVAWRRRYRQGGHRRGRRGRRGQIRSPQHQRPGRLPP